MAGEIPIRAVLGTLGIDAPAGLIMGPRQVAHRLAQFTVTANQTIVFVARSQDFTMLPNDALLVELMSGTTQSTEASGKLTLNSVVASVADATASSCADLPVIAPINFTFPAHGGIPVGVFVQPPPPLRFKDMLDAAILPSLGATPTQPLRLQLQFTVSNADAVDHQISATISTAFRIISGLNP